MAGSRFRFVSRGCTALAFVGLVFLAYKVFLRETDSVAPQRAEQIQEQH